MAKLKNALLAHQARAQRRATDAKAAEAKKAKERSLTHGKSKKAKSKGRSTIRNPEQSTTNWPEIEPVPQNGGLAGPSRSPTGVMANGKGKERSQDPVHRTTPVQTPHVRATANGKLEKPEKRTNPFNPSDTILLLGEANFSFAHSLLLQPHNHDPKRICATSYDDEKTCYQKYPDSKEHVEALRSRGVTIGSGVDAGALENSRKVLGKGPRWSKVVFNFPHVGAGITDQDRNILSNQHLLLRTFRAVAPLLTTGPSRSLNGTGRGEKRKVKRKRKRRDGSESSDDEPLGEEDDDFEDLEDQELDAMDSSHPYGQSSDPPKVQGTILITLLNQPPYTLWNLPKLATHPPPLCPGTDLPQSRYTLLRSFRFHPDLYEGYEHRRTIGWKDGVSKGGNAEIKGRKGEARTWEFALRPQED